MIYRVEARWETSCCGCVGKIGVANREWANVHAVGRMAWWFDVVEMLFADEREAVVFSRGGAEFEISRIGKSSLSASAN